MTPVMAIEDPPSLVDRQFSDPFLWDNVADLNCRARATADAEESPVVEYVRHGVFDCLGGVVDPRLIREPLRLHWEREHGEEVLTPGELGDRRRRSAEVNPYADVLEDTEPVITYRHAAYSSPYHPAYSDSLPDLFGDGMRTAVMKGKAKADDDLTPLVWSVPGHGRNGSYCGILHVHDGSPFEGTQLNVVCAQKLDYVKVASLHCWRPGCSRCFWPWSMRKAREAAERLDVWRQLDPLVTERTLVHVVVSPPQDAALHAIRTAEGLSVLWSAAIRLLTRLGVQTGLTVIHPWRQNSDSLDDGRCEPSYIWRAGPHFHCLGYGFVPESMIAEIARTTGWVVHIVHDDAGVQSPTATVAYLLSHAGLAVPLPAGRGSRQLNAIRWFGGLASGEMCKVHTVKLMETSRCPECGGELHYNDDKWEPATHERKVGIFTKRPTRKQERSAWKQYLADLCESSPDLLNASGDDVADAYTALWYWCQRPNVEFLGKKSFFTKKRLDPEDV